MPAYISTLRRYVSACCLVIFSCLFVSTATAQSDSAFGTLFTTPEEREYLDYLRDEFVRRNQTSNFDIQEDVIPDIPVQVEESPAQQVTEYRFGGVMTSRTGGRLVWLNNRQVPEEDLPRHIRLQENGGNLLMHIQQNGMNYLLKPGESISTGGDNSAPTSASVDNNTPEPGPAMANVTTEPETEPAGDSQVLPEDVELAALIELADVQNRDEAINRLQDTIDETEAGTPENDMARAMLNALMSTDSDETASPSL